MSVWQSLLNIFQRRKPTPEPSPIYMRLSIRVQDSVTGAPLDSSVVLNGVVFRLPTGEDTLTVHRSLFGLGLNVDVYATGYAAQWKPVAEFTATRDLTFDLVANAKPAETQGTADGVLEMRGIAIYEHGARKKLVGIDGFSLLLWWLTDRAKVERYCDWVIAEGIDYIRVFGMFNKGTGQGVGVLIPAEVPDYFGEFVRMATYFRDRRVRIWFDCFADMNLSSVRPTNPLTEVDQPAFYSHIGRLIVEHQLWNVILGGGNQWQGNGWNPGALTPTPGVICARGSGNEETLPWLPPFDLSQFDPGRSEYWRKSKAIRELRDGNTSEDLAVPGRIGGNEPIGVYRSNDGSTSCDARLLWDLYAGMAAFGAAFACIHWRGGISDLEVPTDALALNAIRACVRGFREAPDAYAEAGYARGSSPTEPYNTTLALAHYDDMASRTYELRAGPTSLVFALGITPAWTPVFQDGARPVQGFGYDAQRPTMFVVTRS